jgi:CRISPR-associated exonuclease Cas4
MYAETDLLPISALQHLLFCPRQCALIHVEGLWLENRLTTEGRILHDRVHSGGSEHRSGVRIEFGLPLRSLKLGLAGTADAVAFHDVDPQCRTGGKIPYPVEYKRGRPKKDESDLVQLCAQAMCLEEMLGVPVTDGALFYGRERRRTRVHFSEELRGGTEEAARRLHELIVSGRTPLPEYGKKCRACSLLNSCLPRLCTGRRSVEAYLSSATREDM